MLRACLYLEFSIGVLQEGTAGMQERRNIFGRIHTYVYRVTAD